jgi:choline dehydrogenase-like flavoprotein
VALDPSAGQLPHPGYWDGRPGRYRLGVRLSSELQQREGLLDAYLRFHPILASEGRGPDALRELRRHPSTAIRSRKVMGDLVHGLPDLARFARFKITNRGRVQSAEIHNFLEQVPRPDNRVTLSDRTDRFGTPLPRLAWSIGDLERETIRRLHALLDEDLRRRGFGAVDSPLLGGETEPWGITDDASHHMGTTRMGDDPSTSVVDRDCRVHGVENLYVAGSSVFPTAGYANPTLTILALALRLADHLSG